MLQWRWGVNSLLKTAGEAACRPPPPLPTSPRGCLCLQVGCTVTLDCGCPEGKEPLVRSVSRPVPDFTGRSQTWGVKFWAGSLFWVPSSCPFQLSLPKSPRVNGTLGALLWAGPPPRMCKFSFGAGPPQSPLDSAGLCVLGNPQGLRRATISEGSVVPGWRHLAGLQAGRRDRGAVQVGCCQTGAW